MRDLKIKPGMDTPKAKLKNPAPKDADSILKKHMDKRQQEKEPESRDPVRYATDRVEKNMRIWGSGCLAAHDKALPRKAAAGQRKCGEGVQSGRYGDWCGKRLYQCPDGI